MSDPNKDRRELEELVMELARLEKEMDISLQKAEQLEINILFSQIIEETYGPDIFDSKESEE